MIMFLQTKEVLEGVQEIVKVRDSTVEGVLLGVCIALAITLFYIFRHYKGELRRQEDMYRDEIKDLQKTIREVVESKIKILKENNNDINQVKQLFVDMVREVRGTLSNQRTG